jgi:hypothetical protein
MRNYLELKYHDVHNLVSTSRIHQTKTQTINHLHDKYIEKGKRKYKWPNATTVTSMWRMDGWMLIVLSLQLF